MIKRYQLLWCSCIVLLLDVALITASRLQRDHRMQITAILWDIKEGDCAILLNQEMYEDIPTTHAMSNSGSSCKFLMFF